ncbi:MAG: NAD(P)/FAD-dependent oxidoreductase, partial [Spirochaetaceae bacterium]|nr:NAD(P)/FAD-dependent oxidoreductase [Spirochaetaceae bacterium]
MTRPHRRIVVAGAGLAGLTAATYLARAGYPTLLVEKTGACGGLLNSIERDGFVFDVGARSIENAGVIRPMLKELGIDLELLASPVTIGVEGRMVRMDSPEGTREYQNLLEGLYPGHAGEIRRIFNRIDKVMKDMRVIYGFDNPVFRDFSNDRRYIFTELLPWMRKFLPALARMNRKNQAIEDYLRRLSSFQPLNDIIDQHFFRKTPMFFALGYYFVYQDYFYPRGGTGKFAEKLLEKFLAAGGEVMLDTEIERIVPAEKILSGSKGLDCSYETLVWCADLKSLYRKVDTTGLDGATVDRIDSRRSQVMGSRGGDSVFSLYLGVDRPVPEFAAVTTGHLFYTPSREGLADTYRGELAALLAAPGPDCREGIPAWLRKYCRLTTYEVSIPSLRDPALSPPGRTGIVASFLLEYDLVKKTLDEGWYEEFKTMVEDAMIETLDASLFPGLREA